MAFESITDDKLAELLKLPKRVSNPNIRAKMKDGHEQLNYNVNCIGNDKYRFELYARQNKREGMEDDFSCGLNWVAPNGESLVLCRYNGPNHDHPNHLENEKLGYNCHIHKTTEKYIKANRKPEGFAEKTEKYYTLKGALNCLVNDCNISGISTEQDLPKLF
ncbi:MAG: hypothetical protein NT144_11240 [Bacteroidia bacterium]|nr:hypothetical protein [Bacteroidia bacterium]